MNSPVELRVSLFYHGIIKKKVVTREWFPIDLIKHLGKNADRIICNMMMTWECHDRECMRTFFRTNFDSTSWCDTLDQIECSMRIVGDWNHSEKPGISALTFLSLYWIHPDILEDALAKKLLGSHDFFHSYLCKKITGTFVHPVLERAAIEAAKSQDKLQPSVLHLMRALENSYLVTFDRALLVVEWLGVVEERAGAILKDSFGTAHFEPLLDAAITSKRLKIAKYLIQQDYSFRYNSNLEFLDAFSLSELFRSTHRTLKIQFLLHCWYIQARFNGYTPRSIVFATYLHQLIFDSEMKTENITFSDNKACINELIGNEERLLLERILIQSIDNIMFSELVLRKVCKLWRTILNPSKVFTQSLPCQRDFVVMYFSPLCFKKDRLARFDGLGITSTIFSNPHFTPFMIPDSPFQAVVELMYGNHCKFHPVSLARIIHNLSLCNTMRSCHDCSEAMLEEMSSESIYLLFSELYKLNGLHDLRISESLFIKVLEPIAKHDIELRNNILPRFRSRNFRKRVKMLILLRYFVDSSVSFCLFEAVYGQKERVQQQLLLCELLGTNYIFLLPQVTTRSIFLDLQDQIRVHKFVIHLFKDGLDNLITDKLMAGIAAEDLLAVAIDTIPDQSEFLNTITRMEAHYSGIMSVKTFYGAMLVLLHRQLVKIAT